MKWYDNVEFCAGMHFMALAYEHGCELGIYRDTGNARDGVNNTELVLEGAEGKI